MTSFAVAKDDRLPGLRVLLDTDTVKTLVESQIDGTDGKIIGCRVAYVRYKPGSSCTASYIITCQKHAGDKPQELLWYGKCFAAETFIKAHKQAVSRHWAQPRMGEPVTPLTEHRILLFAYPNDRRLASMPILEHEDRLRQFFGRHLSKKRLLPVKTFMTSVVRYKPETRAVFRCEIDVGSQSGGESYDAVVYLKVYRDGRAAMQHRTMCRLLQWLGRRADLAIPEPLGLARDQHIVLLSSLPGDRLRSTVGTACAREAFERTAQALAVLHDYYDPKLPHRTISDYLAEARRAGHLLAQFAPELKKQTEQINDVLRGRAPRDEECASGFVHGDFHPGQVQLDSSGIGFLDFDRAHTGPVVADLGNMLARLCYLHIKGCLAEDNTFADAFLKAYLESAHKSLPIEVISWWTALALLKITVKPIRRLDYKWPDKVNKLLEEVKRLLECK